MKNKNYYIEIISPIRAKENFKKGIDLYKIFDDDTESLILSEHDLNDALDLGIEIGIRKPLFNTN